MNPTTTLSLIDRLELSDLVHHYAAYVDSRRLDDVAVLFTASGLLILPDPPARLEPAIRHRGRTGVRAALAALGGITRTQHGILGEVFTASSSPDIASGYITGVAHHWIERNGQVTDQVWYLRYRDTYHRTSVGWRIAEREVVIDAIETRSARQVRH